MWKLEYLTYCNFSLLISPNSLRHGGRGGDGGVVWLIGWFDGGFFLMSFNTNYCADMFVCYTAGQIQESLSRKTYKIYCVYIGNRLHLSVSFTVFSMYKYIIFNLFC